MPVDNKDTYLCSLPQHCESPHACALPLTVMPSVSQTANVAALWWSGKTWAHKSHHNQKMKMKKHKAGKYWIEIAVYLFITSRVKTSGEKAGRLKGTYAPPSLGGGWSTQSSVSSCALPPARRHGKMLCHCVYDFGDNHNHIWTFSFWEQPERAQWRETIAIPLRGNWKTFQNVSLGIHSVP